MSGNILYLNAQNFDKEVISSDKPVLVDFYAEWCGPCKMISPIIEQLANQYEGKAKIAKVNVDKNGPIAGKYGVMGVPSLVFFKNGKEINRLVGAQPKGQMTNILDQLID